MKAKPNLILSAYLDRHVLDKGSTLLFRKEEIYMLHDSHIFSKLLSDLTYSEILVETRTLRLKWCPQRLRKF